MKDKIWNGLLWAGVIWWAAYMSVRLWFPQHLAFPFDLLDLLTILFIPAAAILGKLLGTEPAKPTREERFLWNGLFLLPFLVALLQFVGIM